MAYTKTNWVNDSTPAINADNLNKIEQGIYDNSNAIDEVNNISIAKLITNGTASFTSEAMVSGIWTNEFQAGDYIADVSNNRIVITNTEIVEVTGMIGGNGASWSGIVIEDENGNIVDEKNSRRPLYQFSSYWSAPLPVLYYQLDKTKTYYAYLYCAGYNTTFALNSGLGGRSSFITARKVK